MVAFRREIGGVIEVGPLDGPVGEIDDATAFGLLHHLQAGVAAAEEGAQRVGLEMLPHVFGCHIFQTLSLPNGGAVHQHIQPAKMLQSLIEHGLDGVFVGNVCLNRHGVSARAAKFCDGLLGIGLGAAVMDDDPVATLGERIHDGGTDAVLTAAGN